MSSTSIDRVLAIETSCDDTSVAVVSRDGYVVQCLSADQDFLHREFGGIVPEIASRNHTDTLLPLVEKVLGPEGWDQIDGIAVTNRPGLLGSLLVGVVTAKTLALTKGVPLIAVNHLEGHILAPFLHDDKQKPVEGFDYPFLALAASGGHTSFYLVEGVGQYKVLGRTIDDAAGEAFDKFGKMLGLGFPGGVAVDRESQAGDATKYQFPRPMIKKPGADLSFSGLKTAAKIQIEKIPDIESEIPHLCASFQQAIVDVLIKKLDRLVDYTGCRKVVITGGVSANSRLRQVGEEWSAKKKVKLVMPPLRYCTDNAAMIGYAGIQRLNRGERSGQDTAPMARSLAEDFT